MRNIVLFCYFWLTFATINAQTIKWGGFEILGQRKITKQEIIKLLPMKVGTPYRRIRHSESKAICNRIQKRFSFVHVNNMVLITFFDPKNPKAYLVIDIVDKGEEYRIQFRPSPKGNVPLATAQILNLHRKIGQRQQEMMLKLRIPVYETIDKGYLDYPDPQLSAIVKKLLKLVPAHRSNLIQVIQNDKDSNKRAIAATLLNWAGEPINTVKIVAELLDDPSQHVRNNISRYMIHVIAHVKSRSVRHHVIDKLLLQLNRPSHGDRNKALGNLQQIVKTYKQDAHYIKKRGEKLLQYICKNSVISNVKGVAKEILIANNQ